MKKDVLSENGLTLVEILASIVILSIVLIAFMSFFLQSSKYTKYNKEKLTAVQVAENVVADVREGIYPDNRKYTEISHEGYEVEIEVDDGPVDNLKIAVITVKSVSDVGIKVTPFITEMYFEVIP